MFKYVKTVEFYMLVNIRVACHSSRLIRYYRSREEFVFPRYATVTAILMVEFSWTRRASICSDIYECMYALLIALLIILCRLVMSTGEKDNDVEFDIKKWLSETRISDAGVKKLFLHEVRDFESLILMSHADIASIKLATADRAKFLHAVDGLVSSRKPQLEGDKPTGTDSSGIAVKNISETEKPDLNREPAAPVTLPSQFSLSDVAGFLAGKPIPENLQQTIVNLGHQEVISKNPNLNLPPVNVNVPPPSLSNYAGTAVGSNPVQHPALPASLQSAFAGLSLFEQTSSPTFDRAQPQLQQLPQHLSARPVVASYERGHPTLQQQQYQPLQSTYSSNIPTYNSPYNQLQNSAFVPSRQNTLQTLDRDSYLQSQASGYRQSAFSDSQILNSCVPVRPGESLYLPVNFCSHLRGHKSEDKEILCTENGTKL